MSGATATARGAQRAVDSARRLPLGVVLVATVLYSTGPVLAQASAVSGTVFAFWRLWFGIGVLGVAAAVLRARGGARLPRGRSWVWVLAGGATFGLHQLLFFSAVKATSVATVALIGTLGPVVVGLLAIRLFNERPTAGFVGWGGVAMLGAALVALAGAQGPQGDPVGVAMALANVVFLGLFFVATKGARSDVDTVSYLLAVMVVAALIVSLGVVALGEPVASATGGDLALAATVAAGPGFLGHFGMTWALRFVPANVPSVAKLAQPVLSGLLAWAVLAETVTATHIAGGLVTLVGVGGALLGRGSRDFARGRGRASPEPAPPEAAPSDRIAG